MPTLRAILAEQAAQELRYAGSVTRPSNAPDRRVWCCEARCAGRFGRGEIEAAHRGETAPFDRIQANVLLRRDAQAARIYERLVAAGIEVPAYADISRLRLRPASTARACHCDSAPPDRGTADDLTVGSSCFTRWSTAISYPPRAN